MSLLAAGLCGLVGLTLGLLGGGGSVLTVPIFIYAAGLEMKQAIATSLIIVGVSSAIGAAGAFRRGHVNRRLVGLFILPGIPSAYLGSRLTASFDDHLLLLWFGILVTVIGGVLYMKARTDTGDERPEIVVCRPPVALSVLIGASIGFLTGFLGVGGGFLIVPAIALLMKCALRTAIGTSLAIIAVNSLSALPGQPALSSLDPRSTAVYLALTILGAWAGALAAQRIRAQALQRIFAVLIFCVGSFLVANHFVNLSGG